MAVLRPYLRATRVDPKGGDSADPDGPYAGQAYLCPRCGYAWVLLHSVWSACTVGRLVVAPHGCANCAHPQALRVLGVA